DMPQKLRDAGGLMDIVYDSPLTRAQMAEEAVGVMRTIEAAGLLAQYDEGESVRDIDSHWTLSFLAKANGAPVRMMKPR
ncbi:portal protein, partial [Acinetobacter baumannii]